jgi:hypothetical protein
VAGKGTCVYTGDGRHSSRSQQRDELLGRLENGGRGVANDQAGEPRAY